MALATTEELQEYLHDEQGAASYYDLDGCLTVAEQMLEDICGRKWVVATTATTRVYAPRSWSDSIRIHDATTVTAVVNDGTTLSPSLYQLEPLNGMDWTGEARPYEQIRYIGSLFAFDNYRATVSVTATWGWLAIPDQIKRAVLILAKDIAVHRDIAFGNLGVADTGAVRARQAPLIRDLTKRYRREEAKAGIGGPI